MIPPGPECAIIAGPNGAGKSSIFKRVSLPGQFINADDVARQLNPEKASLEAGRTVTKTLDAVLTAGADFSYETTLSSHQSLRVIRRAKGSGYRILLIFVALYSATLHVKRVRQRV
jgi:predicted ABC-type ATPase